MRQRSRHEPLSKIDCVFFGALVVLLLLACTGSTPTDDTSSDSAVDTQPDTQDTADVEPTPVWTQWPVGASSTLNGVYASGAGVYVAGTGATLYDGGADVDWQPINTGLEDEDFNDIWGAGAEDTLELFVPATSGNVAHYASGTWAIDDLGTPDHQGVGGSDRTSLFAVSWGGIYAYDGANWTYEATPADEKLNEVWGIGADAFAVGEAGAILRRSGGKWAGATSGVTTDLNGVAGVATNDVWAVGADGVALHWDGSTWTPTTTGTTSALWAVFAPESNSVYAVGSNGVAIHWDGTEWTSLPTGISNNLYAVHGASSTNVWAVGNRGMAIQYKAP